VTAIRDRLYTSSRLTQQNSFNDRWIGFWRAQGYAQPPGIDEQMAIFAAAGATDPTYLERLASYFSASALPSYTRADPYVFASGNHGSTADDDRLIINAPTGTATIAYQTAVKRSGLGSWKKTGGTTTAGENALVNSGSLTATDVSEGWQGMAVRFDAWPTNASKYWLMVWNCYGTAPPQGCASKPTVFYDNNGHIWFGGGGIPASQVDAGALTLGQWYYIIYHFKTSNGSDGNISDCYIFNGDTGHLINHVTTQWDYGSASSGDNFKWGGGTVENTTGTVFYFEDLGIFKSLTTLPGPLLGYTLWPSSLVAAGNFTVVGAADLVAAVIETPNDGDTSYADVNNAALSKLVYDVPDPAIPATDQVHCVLAKGVEKHVATSPSPRPKFGIRQGATDSLVDIANTSTSYVLKICRVSVDPVTGIAFTPAGIGTLNAVASDEDTQAREWRLTQFSLDVVTAQVAV
jgi:hypothetical protein